jgi:hypothetical protein
MQALQQLVQMGQQSLSDQLEQFIGLVVEEELSRGAGGGSGTGLSG